MAAIALLLVLAGVLFAKPAHAETFSVNSTNHPGTGGCDEAECTLNEAISAANSNGQSDTIGFAPSLSGDILLSAEAGGFTIQNDSPEEDLTINGPGAGVLAIDGNGQVRPFEIASGAKAIIDRLTIKNGSHNAGGGGGIYTNGGTLTVTNSTISGNSTSDLGGGGILNRGGTLTVTNSTISGNSAGNYGGGIFNWGGISSLANTIVAGNSATLGNPDTSGDPFTSQGYNLIGNTGDSSGWSDSDDLLNLDPLLKPLALNAPGSTQTHALKANSPAINAIPTGTNGCSTTITTDQTGTKRPQGAGCDIGSYENKSPRVKGVSPKEGAAGVAPKTKVRAFFSQGVQRDSVTEQTFKLYKVEGTSTTEVAAQVRYDAAKKVGILTPSAPLERGAIYRAVVSTEVTDLAGNRLDQDRDPTNGNQNKVWSFTVSN